MIRAIERLGEIPCMSVAQDPIEPQREAERFLFLSTREKAGFIAAFILALVGGAVGAFLPVAGGVILGLGALVALCVLIPKLIDKLKQAKSLDVTSDLEKIEKLPAAQELGADIDISPGLQRELEDVVPLVDDLEVDERIATCRYTCHETAVFTLHSAPGLQFRVCPPNPSSYLGCDEFNLQGVYLNTVCAHMICQKEGYDRLFVPSLKPIYLQIGGLRRTLLVERTLEVLDQMSLDLDEYEEAIRQMVRFLLKTGDGRANDPIPFLPIEGGRVALRGIYHLLETPNPDPATAEHHQAEMILAKSSSLIASLKRPDLINLALEELQKNNPSWLGVEEEPGDEIGRDARQEEIQEARERRLKELNRSGAPYTPLIPCPNFLGVTPENLDLDLSLRDYVVLKQEGVHEDGECRVITLREVAQALIDLINHKLQNNPNNPELQFSKEEMTIGTTFSHFWSDDHVHYNTLQGLGYRHWPDPNQCPPYWIDLIFQALQNKGLVTNYSLFLGIGRIRSIDAPRLTLNLDQLQSVG